MNRDIVEGNWKQFKGKAAVLWGHLTDNRRQVFSGERVEREGRIQEDYGRTRDEYTRQIKAFARVNKDYRLQRLS